MFVRRHFPESRWRLSKLLKKLRFVVHLFFYVVCVGQLAIYAAFYLEYRTTVQVNYVAPNRIEIPSITMCLPRLLTDEFKRDADAEEDDDSEKKATDYDLAEPTFDWIRNLSKFKVCPPEGVSEVGGPVEGASGDKKSLSEILDFSVFRFDGLKSTKSFPVAPSVVLGFRQTRRL